MSPLFRYFHHRSLLHWLKRNRCKGPSWKQQPHSCRRFASKSFSSYLSLIWGLDYCSRLHETNRQKESQSVFGTDGNCLPFILVGQWDSSWYSCLSTRFFSDLNCSLDSCFDAAACDPNSFSCQLCSLTLCWVTSSASLGSCSRETGICLRYLQLLHMTSCSKNAFLC